MISCVRNVVHVYRLTKFQQEHGLSSRDQPTICSLICYSSSCSRLQARLRTPLRMEVSSIGFYVKSFASKGHKFILEVSSYHVAQMFDYGFAFPGDDQSKDSVHSNRNSELRVLKAIQSLSNCQIVRVKSVGRRDRGADFRFDRTVSGS